MSSYNYPVSGGGGGSSYWADAVATFASLPVSGTVVGEIRLVLDTSDLYEWNGSAWVRITENTADVTGPASSVDSEIAIYNGVTGKIIKRATGTGFVKVVSGVMQAPVASVSLTSEVSGILPIVSGGSNSNVALNNNRVMRSTTGSIVEAAAITAARALISDADGIPTHSVTTATELGYLSGLTSAIQAQIDSKVAKNGDTMTGLLVLSADPSVALGAATKQYVDALSNGQRWKAPTRVATTANVDLTTDLENGDTIDGVVLVTGDRVLVKNQTATDEDGIYIVPVSGAAARSADADSANELNSACVFVSEGTANANKGFYQTQELTSLSDPQVWVQNFGTGLYTADGQGIELSGSTFSLELDGTTLSKSATGLKVADLGIADAQVATNAAIARSKLAAGTVNRLAYNDGSTGLLVDLAAITASRALASDANGLPVAVATTATELGYVNGVTSAIQTQLDAKLAPTSVAAVSTNLTLTNKRIHLVDTTAARSLTLPSPSATSFIVVKDATGTCSTNNITIVRAASESIETVAASYVLDYDLGSWTFVSDGTNWFII